MSAHSPLTLHSAHRPIQPPSWVLSVWKASYFKATKSLFSPNWERERAMKRALRQGESLSMCVCSCVSMLLRLGQQHKYCCGVCKRTASVCVCLCLWAGQCVYLRLSWGQGLLELQSTGSCASKLGDRVRLSVQPLAWILKSKPCRQMSESDEEDISVISDTLNYCRRGVCFYGKPRGP